MKIKNLFNKEARLKSAFKAVQIDMDCIDMRQEAFKDSANEWIIQLDQENRTLKARVAQIERRLSSTNDTVSEMNIEVLREI